MHPLKQYYLDQAATGLTGFQGIRYQKGHGFLGRLMSKAVVPLLKFLAPRALDVGSDILKDVVVNKRGIREATKRRLEAEGEELLDLGVDKAKQAIRGSGRKRIKRLKNYEEMFYS